MNPSTTDVGCEPEARRLAILRSIHHKDLFTKMDLVRDVHLSLPTINSILADLQQEGYITPVGNAKSRGGRPPAQYRFNPTVRYAIGVEIKIPTLSIGLVDLRGQVMDVVEYPFEDSTGSEYVTETLERGIERLLLAQQVETEKLIGIGLGVPGFVERDSGVWLSFLWAPRIRELPLRTFLEKRFHVPVFIQNEMNVYASAELHRSQRQIVRDALIITCAEGLKASVVVDGRILSGDHGNFGSVGHFIVVENGHLCHCGARGCLEMYVSGHAFRRLWLTTGCAIPGVDDLQDPSLPDRIFRLAAEGEPTCRAIIEQVIPYMAYAFAGLIRLTDIDHVVLLGAFAEGGDYLRDLLQANVAERLPEVARKNLSFHIGDKLGVADLLAAAAFPAIQASLGYTA